MPGRKRDCAGRHAIQGWMTRHRAMNAPLRYPVGVLLAAALLSPWLSQARTEYGVGKAKLYMQSGHGALVADPIEPFEFDALSSAAGSLTLPNGQSDPLVFNSKDNLYEVFQSYTSQTVMDQAFPSGTYSFVAPGQAPVNLALTGDLYPPPPQVLNGNWNAVGQLLVDPGSDFPLNFNTFAQYATAGMAGEVTLMIQPADGAADVLDLGWTTVDTPQVVTNATIPLATLSAGGVYTAYLSFSTDTVVDATSVPGSILIGLYISTTKFTILAQAPAGGAPVATSQPESQTIAGSSTVVFSFSANGSPAPSYQWYLNGAPIASATQPTLVILGANAANAGNYYCRAANSSGSVQSSTATLAISGTNDVGRLVNISCRAQVGTGGNILIAGFAVGGAGTSGLQPVLIRGSGPALGPFGLPGTLPDPQLQLYRSNNDGTSTWLKTNNGWAGDSGIAGTASAVGAFAWTNASSHDSALLASLAGGPCTAQVAGQVGDTGVALAEVYDATPEGAYTPASPRLVNISARVQVGTGGNILIAGFVIGGSTSRTVLIRASGPALVPFGVTGTLADPQLQLYRSNSDGTSALLSTNSGWGGRPQIANVAASVGAFAWGNPASADSAILATLPPGAYTAQVSGASGDTGVALAEVYEVP